ncbi:MAG: hypothetical protein JXR91_04230 [Deltaproteobacteria bacterium]|nr:hypothetical protein [Deltaproteobacteria bacterium]
MALRFNKLWNVSLLIVLLSIPVSCSDTGKKLSYDDSDRTDTNSDSVIYDSDSNIIGGTDSDSAGDTSSDSTFDSDSDSAVDSDTYYDYSSCEIGFNGDGSLPEETDYTSNENCIIKAQKMIDDYSVIPDDSGDDTTGIQSAIDYIRTSCTGSKNSYSVIELPSGVLNITRQIGVDADYLVLKGQGSNPDSSQFTKVIFTPDNNTRYVGISDFDMGELTDPGGGNGGWIWPGRGAFRIQTREVSSKYTTAYASAPQSAKDFYEGSVNFHWVSGIKLTQKSMAGESVIHVENTTPFSVGTNVWVGAANSDKFYEMMGVLPAYRIRGHMRQQIFTVTAVGAGTITIDSPLEFDLYINSTEDGSSELGGTGSANLSKVIPLKVVEGTGIENLIIEQSAPSGVTADDAVHSYNNLDHEGAMHGIVMKWANNVFVRNVRTYMTGSHPVVTEFVRYASIKDNYFEGAWNKGKGGNGYLRLSKIWNSLITGNITRGIRHLTLQWSASGNIVAFNNIDSDINLHGGWERYNIVENNLVAVPFEHRECNPVCTAQDGTWYPLWWAAGEHAGEWAGASGPGNIIFKNTLTKQLTEGGGYTEFSPYSNNPSTVYFFGWDRDTASGTKWEHLAINGTDISTWTNNETTPFFNDPNSGINNLCSFEGTSLTEATTLASGAGEVSTPWNFCR